MKNQFVAFCCMLTTCACEKVISPSTSKTSNLESSEIQSGAMFQHTTASEKISNASLFDVRIVRSSVSFYSWNGTNSPQSDALTHAGIINILNVNEIPNNGSGYNTIDTGLFASHLTTLAQHSNPAKVIWAVFNEMGNIEYWNIKAPSDMLPYIWCAKIAVRIGHQYGFRVTDGGFISSELVYWTYRQMSNAHDPDTTNFLHYCIPVTFQNGCVRRTNSSINKQVRCTDYLLTRFVRIDFDYNNLHLYVPFAKSFVDTATNYSTAYTGLNKIFYYFRQHSAKPILTNEFGIMDRSFVAPVLKELQKNNTIIVVYYNDPTQRRIETIFDSFNALTPFGKFYKRQINKL